VGERGGLAAPGLCPNMAHSSCDSQVLYIVYPQIPRSGIVPGMPSRHFLCPKVAIFQRIHL